MDANDLNGQKPDIGSLILAGVREGMDFLGRIVNEHPIKGPAALAVVGAIGAACAASIGAAFLAVGSIGAALLGFSVPMPLMAGAFVGAGLGSFMSVAYLPALEESAKWLKNTNREIIERDNDPSQPERRYSYAMDNILRPAAALTTRTIRAAFGGGVSGMDIDAAPSPAPETTAVPVSRLDTLAK